MTTAFSHMAHGDPWVAFTTQPAGAIGFVGAALYLVTAPVIAIVGRRPAGSTRLLHHRRALLCAGALLLVAWIYKIVIIVA